MTMVSTGEISLGGSATSGGLNRSVNIELGRSATATINLNEAAVRTLAGVPSGAISLSNFYGKSNRVAISFTFSSSTANATRNVTSISGYVAGASDITITVNSGVFLHATSTANAGLTLSGGTSGDTITLVNNGFIMGQGGQGSISDSNGVNNLARAGGPALSLGFNTTVNNTNAAAFIGGGGGGGGSASSAKFNTTGGGGGAGGGAGGDGLSASNIDAGGAGGGIGAAGGNGVGGAGGSGGGGGRIFPGTGGAAVTAVFSGGSTVGGLGGGAGGSGAARSLDQNSAVSGAGGSSNGTGGNGARLSGTGGAAGAAGGGGWGASGGVAFGSRSDATRESGAGGRAVQLNGFAVTFVAGDTARVFGAVS